MAAITHLFLDVGGVLLTNGWDHVSRKKAAEHFELDYSEYEQRHQQNFSILEEGRLSLDEYLNRTIFYQERSFTREQFRQFIFDQSETYQDMLEFMVQLKKQHGLKIAVVSNESREVNEYRIQKFKLNHFVDAFISSCFVGSRKPDTEIYRLALDIAQAKPENVLYIENTKMFIEIAESLGIQSIYHKNYSSTKEQIERSLQR